MRGQGDVWQLQEAKARFSEVVDRALAGHPQRVTRHGKPAVVVIAQKDFETMGGQPETLVSFLLHSPIIGSDIEIPRLNEPYVPRVDFSEGFED